MVFTRYWACMWPSQVSQPLARAPEPDGFSAAPMQGSRGVSTLERGLSYQHECESGSGRKEGFM